MHRRELRRNRVSRLTRSPASPGSSSCSPCTRPSATARGGPLRHQPGRQRRPRRCCTPGTVGARVHRRHQRLHGHGGLARRPLHRRATPASGGAAVGAPDRENDDRSGTGAPPPPRAGLLPTLTAAPPGERAQPERPGPAARTGCAAYAAATLASFGQVQMTVAEAGHGFVRTAVAGAGRGRTARHRPGVSGRTGTRR